MSMDMRYSAEGDAVISPIPGYDGDGESDSDRYSKTRLQRTDIQWTFNSISYQASCGRVVITVDL